MIDEAQTVELSRVYILTVFIGATLREQIEERARTRARVIYGAHGGRRAPGREPIPESARRRRCTYKTPLSWHSTFVTHRVSRMMGTPHALLRGGVAPELRPTLSLVEGHSALVRSAERTSKHVSPCVHERGPWSPQNVVYDQHREATAATTLTGSHGSQTSCRSGSGGRQSRQSTQQCLMSWPPPASFAALIPNENLMEKGRNVQYRAPYDFDHEVDDVVDHLTDILNELQRALNMPSSKMVGNHIHP